MKDFFGFTDGQRQVVLLATEAPHPHPKAECVQKAEDMLQIHLPPWANVDRWARDGANVPELNPRRCSALRQGSLVPIPYTTVTKTQSLGGGKQKIVPIPPLAARAPNPGSLEQGSL